MLISAPSPLVGEGYTDARVKLVWVRGSRHNSRSQGGERPLTRQPSAATLSHKGRGYTVCVATDTNYTTVKNGSGAPSVGLNTTFTFWPIFKLSMSQSTMLVCSDGPSFSVT